MIDAPFMADQGTIDPRRGVYTTKRAAALAGIPRTTLDYWVRTGLLRPSIQPMPRPRLWSWLDLLALRAIDWLRSQKSPGEPPKVTIHRVRRALGTIDELGKDRAQLRQLLLVDSGGELFLRVGPELHARFGPGMQLAMPRMLHLVEPYRGEQASGPNLLIPRPRLRIIPGKLHGEPHVQDTRIQSATLYALDRDGYTRPQILRMYPDVTPEDLADAIDLESSLEQAAA